MSLKEALDAAHGHAHAEDGSELTEANKPKDQHLHEEEKSGHAPGWILYYSGGSTLLMLLFAQLWWNAKRREGQADA